MKYWHVLFFLLQSMSRRFRGEGMCFALRLVLAGFILFWVNVGEVQAQLTITTQPVPQVVCEGGTVTFTVAVTGATGTVSYQWLKDGVVMG
ncbi:MAG TPA: immunoglobulin domain-containing protein, partial [Bacteroidales bacterium]|nr:immunoglobulin domain-containing protein [Bacteroidales bacterium]